MGVSRADGWKGGGGSGKRGGWRREEEENMPPQHPFNSRPSGLHLAFLLSACVLSSPPPWPSRLCQEYIPDSQRREGDPVDQVPVPSLHLLTLVSFCSSSCEQAWQCLLLFVFQRGGPGHSNQVSTGRSQSEHLSGHFHSTWQQDPQWGHLLPTLCGCSSEMKLTTYFTSSRFSAVSRIWWVCFGRQLVRPVLRKKLHPLNWRQLRMKMINEPAGSSVPVSFSLFVSSHVILVHLVNIKCHYVLIFLFKLNPFFMPLLSNFD